MKRAFQGGIFGIAFGFAAACVFSLLYSNSRSADPDRIIEKAQSNIEELEKRTVSPSRA